MSDDVSILALTWYDAGSNAILSANIPAAEFVGGSVTLSTPQTAVRVDGTYVLADNSHIDFSEPCHGKQP